MTDQKPLFEGVDPKPLLEPEREVTVIEEFPFAEHECAAPATCPVCKAARP